MKKLLVLACLLLSSLGLGLHAQVTKGPSLGLWYEYGLNKPFRTSDMMSANLVAGFGYSFNGKWFVRIPVKYAVGLYKMPETKTFEGYLVMGGTVGYDVVNTSTHVIELTLTAGGTVTKGNYQYAYYDVGAALHIGPQQDITKLQLVWDFVTPNLSVIISRIIRACM